MSKSLRKNSRRFMSQSVVKLLLTTAFVSLTVSACGQPETANRLSLSTSPTNSTSQKNKSVSLVSLGDSITFGEHLPGSKLGPKFGDPGTPSKDAFPFLIAKNEKWSVHDLGIPGYTSGELLRFMKHKRVKKDLKTADIVTLDIGSDDLIQAAYKILEQMFKDPAQSSPQAQQAIFSNALNTYAQNLPQIVADIRKQTNAPIILMTLYDPFPSGNSLHDITEPLLAKANQTILETAVAHHCLVANIYSVMNNHQDQLIRVKNHDIHPTQAGQRAIANVIENVISNSQNYRPEQYIYTSSNISLYPHPRPSNSPGTTVSAGHLIQVVGRQKDWLRVITSTGAVGYVQRTGLHLIDWPWPRNNTKLQQSQNQQSNQNQQPNQDQQTSSVPIQSGQVILKMTTSPLQGFEYHHVKYAALSAVAQAIGANLQISVDTQTINVQTQKQSGIKGWVDAHKAAPVLHYYWPPYETSAQIAEKGDYKLRYVNTGTTQFVQLQSTDYLFQIDGEPLRLNAPILELGPGQFLQSGTNLYIPIYSVWKALGGSVKR